ncbi:MAG TPA: HlyD family efflux transporter periplasmic adaptor subunit [Xanthobacteraceae bacterium]|nr:HlyD family efflux transporter periplasmic adaptor subunit [Xanthobacteraceae bacterium]
MTARISFGRMAGALLLLAAAAALVWSLRPNPVSVEIVEVTKGRFVATVDEDGKTRIRERYVVSAPLAGRLTRIKLKAGDRVAVGDVVATILPTPAPFLDPRSRREAQERVGMTEAALDRARALVERAKAQAEQADQELKRTRTLVARGVSTQQALERAELAKSVADRDLRAAEFQLHAAEHELDQARALLARYDGSEREVGEAWTVTAPVNGVVLKVDQESETVVQPGTAVLEIGDAGDLEVVVDVLSTEAVEIRAGAQVTIENWGGEGTLEGRVRRVEPAAFTKISTLGVEEQRVNVLIDIVSPPERWRGLGDGFQVDARIAVYVADDAIIVPSGALFRRGETWNVFVVENGRAQPRPVSVIRRSGRLAAIASGAAEGESVIVYPSDRIGAGVRVTRAAR